MYGMDDFHIKGGRSKKEDKKEKYNKWDYLSSKPFQIRQEKVAEFLQEKNHEEIDTIIEIGGAGCPMSQFITDRNVIVIDPAVKRIEDKLVTHIRTSFQKWNVQLTSEKYAVVLLGLHLEKMDIKDWQKLYSLINGAQRMVLEYSKKNQIGLDQMQTIAKETRKVMELIATEEFTISSDNSHKYHSIWPDRVMCYFKKKMDGKLLDTE